MCAFIELSACGSFHVCPLHIHHRGYILRIPTPSCWPILLSNPPAAVIVSPPRQQYLQASTGLEKWRALTIYNYAASVISTRLSTWRSLSSKFSCGYLFNLVRVSIPLFCRTFCFAPEASPAGNALNYMEHLIVLRGGSALFIRTWSSDVANTVLPHVLCSITATSLQFDCSCLSNVCLALLWCFYQQTVPGKVQPIQCFLQGLSWAVFPGRADLTMLTGQAKPD